LENSRRTWLGFSEESTWIPFSIFSRYAAESSWALTPQTIFTFLFASQDATSAASTWLFQLMADRPEILEGHVVEHIHCGRESAITVTDFKVLLTDLVQDFGANPGRFFREA
jgi:hypothetical protein